MQKGFNNSFKVVPENIPNNGILYVDHSRNGRSGHLGNCLTECSNGDIISFYSNTSGGEDNIKGHGVAGWSEYRRSTDSGKTWGEPIVFDYTKKIWDGSEVFSALVLSVTTAPDGSLIAIASRFKDEYYRKQKTPVYFLSHDNGKTWSESREVDAGASVEELSMTFDAVFVHEGNVYVVFLGGSGQLGGGPYTLYVSKDNGETFIKRSTLPFSTTNYYSTATVLDNGDFIVYSYPYPGDMDAMDILKRNEMSKEERSQRWSECEHNLHYVISKDKGYSWSEARKAYFAKRLRNPQMSGKIGDYYFMHGRSGNHGGGSGNLVLYSSKDGINWDEGIYLHKKIYPGGDKYTANEIIGKYDPSKPERLFIQSSIVYDADTSRVNLHHWWIEDIAVTEVNRN